MPCIVAREQMCNGLSMLNLDADNPKWKLARKVTWSNVGSISRANEGLQYLHYETLKFLYEVVSDKNLRESGSALTGALKRYTYSNFGLQMFGLDVPNLSDAAIDYIHETGTAQALATIPGFYLVDRFPILDKLPLFLKPWERDARERFRRDMRWVTDKLRRVQAMSDSKRSFIKDSLMSKIVEDEKNLGFPSKEEGAYLCLQLTIAGSDTSQVSVWCFLEAMMRYADVQKKAQRLVDEVVGDRIPVFEDHERIPYIRCLVKETLRWRPPVSLGQAHMTTADIEFEGMRIPKGACIQINAWAIQHDPARHQDPDRFWPERYAGDHTSVMESLNAADETQRDHFAFGAGRRVCSGYNVAERSLTVAILRILWAFNVKVNPDAEDPLDGTKWTGIFPGTPGDAMPVQLIPRSERVAIIEREFEAARSERVLLVSIRTSDLLRICSYADIRGRNRLMGSEREALDRGLSTYWFTSLRLERLVVRVLFQRREREARLRLAALEPFFLGNFVRESGLAVCIVSGSAWSADRYGSWIYSWAIQTRAEYIVFDFAKKKCGFTLLACLSGSPEVGLYHYAPNSVLPQKSTELSNHRRKNVARFDRATGRTVTALKEDLGKLSYVCDRMVRRWMLPSPATFLFSENLTISV